MLRARWGEVILRFAAAFAFIYPPIDGFFQPDSWIGYFPKFVLSAAQTAGVSDLVLLHSFAIGEIILAIWILSGKNIFYPCVIATIVLIGIVACNLGQFEIVFRDLSIAGLTLGLAFIHKNNSVAYN